MNKLILSEMGKVKAGYNLVFAYKAAGITGGRIKIFENHIEFKFIQFTKKLNISDIDYVEMRGNLGLWFAHHAKTSKWFSYNEKPSRFLGIFSSPPRIKRIIDVLKKMGIKIRKGKPLKLSPYYNIKE